MNNVVHTLPNGDFEVQYGNFIVVYSQANCPGCSALKMQLKALGYEFTEMRIDLDPEAKAFILENGHRSVPVMYVNGKHTTLAELKEGK